MRHRIRRFFMCGAAAATLSACGGGGGGGGVSSTPTPTPAPTPTPTPAPAPTPTPSSFNTSEYRSSPGPVYHGAITAYDAGASGAGIIVGIIDSGIDTDNSEFTGRISSASRAFSTGLSPSDIQDVGGHGTAVATVLAGARNNDYVLGMAWGATILALRTDTPGSCTNSDPDTGGCSHNDTAIAAALDHARTNGAKVVNISLGGDGGASSGLLNAIDRATAAGIIIVVSAGNDGPSELAPNAFAVDLVTRGRGLVIIAGSNNSSGAKSSFSNGAQGDVPSYLTALGERIPTQDEVADRGFLYSGTSFSAPQITGAVALLEQAFPTLTPAQVVQLLMDSATDAGAAGDDDVFGQGILNIAAAFAPRGGLSLAGSRVAIGDDSGSLSAAMGDAGNAGSLGVVALDGLGRAYGARLGGGLRRDLPDLTLAPAMATGRTSFTLNNDRTRIAVSLTATPQGGVESRRLMLSRDDAGQARALSGHVAQRLGAKLQFALGFSESASALTGLMADEPGAAYLSAGAAAGNTGFRRDVGNAAALRLDVGAGVALSIGVEQGNARVRQDPARVRLGDETQPYASVTLGADRRFGPLRVKVGATWLDEASTVLGARFGPALGGGSARTLFADAGLMLEAGGGWRIGAAWRQGWTWTGDNGGLAAGSLLRTNAWSLDATREGLWQATDQFSLRLSQPLRVSSGGLSLRLPVAYDYATRTATIAVETLNLAPSGRELDAEAVYATPLGDGWLTTNLYWRRQAGNLAWYPDDYAGALRYSLTF